MSFLTPEEMEKRKKQKKVLFYVGLFTSVVSLSAALSFLLG